MDLTITIFPNVELVLNRREMVGDSNVRIAFVVQIVDVSLLFQILDGND